jgi:AhpD family alkylhydroperoxidase
VKGQVHSPWYRAKAPAEVVRDALAMASRKRQEGCEPCAEAYLSLAREHGATDQQVAAALRTDRSTTPNAST